MADNIDMISQAMGILGGGKKKDSPQKPAGQPLLPRPLREATAMAPAPVPAPAPVGTASRLTKAERVVVKELARYAALHAALIEMRHEIEKGTNPMLVEQRLEETLRNAKVVIK
jgi:hypothetical protein